MKATSKAVAVAPSADVPAIVRAKRQQVEQALTVNLGNTRLDAFDLTRIRVPTGGGTEWVWETFQGEMREKSIEGVITVSRDIRTYWKNPFGSGEGNQPPDCASPDGITGFGDPGGECAVCPMNVFGTKGRGKLCREGKQIFLHRGTSMMPEVLQLPPTSIQLFRSYLLWLAGQMVPYYSVVTQFTLAPVKNASGILYSEARFRKVADLTEEETQSMTEIHNMFKAYVERLPVQAADEEG